MMVFVILALSWSLPSIHGDQDDLDLTSILTQMNFTQDDMNLMPEFGIFNDSNNGLYIKVGNDDLAHANSSLLDLDNLLSLLEAGSGDKESTFQFITEGVLLLCISVFGLVGNIISIIVLSRPSMKGSFSTLLIGLASFDLLYLTIGIAIFGLPAVSSWYNSHVYVHILPVGFGFGHIGRVGSVFVTMSVTIERYFAIVHPLKHFSQKKFLLLGSAILSVVYNIPKFFEMEKKLHNDTNVTYVSGTSLRSNPIYVTYYIFWSKFIFVEVIPYFTILILNSLIIGKIWKSSKFRKRFVDGELDPEQTSRQKREANLGVVLISISVLFILCQSVKIVPDVYEAAFCRLGSTEGSLPTCPITPLLNKLAQVSHLLLAINSSANFVIYTWRGEKFREVLTSTFGFGQCKKNARQRHSRGNIELNSYQGKQSVVINGNGLGQQANGSTGHRTVSVNDLTDRKLKNNITIHLERRESAV